MVLYVGDKPSSKNINPDIAFVGTKSYKTLMAWNKTINPEPKLYTAINRVSENFEIVVKVARTLKTPIVALGEEASKALNDTPHFKLPHPSGRNFKLNDKEWLQEQLNFAKIYIKERK